MPYATMTYQGRGLYPSLYSYSGLASDVAIDDNGTSSLKCSTADDGKGNTVPVQKHMKMHFINSDFTWIVFFSKPASVRCHMSDGDEFTRDFTLSVLEDDITVRVALLNQCTTGKSNIQQHCSEKAQFDDQQRYEQLLMDHAHILPTNPVIDFSYGNNNSSNDNDNVATDMIIDWRAKEVTTDGNNRTAPTNDEGYDTSNDGLLMFALPHHQEALVGADKKLTKQCTFTFHGETCLVLGSKWVLSQAVGRPLSFWAPRPPRADIIPTLAEALSKDIQYRLAANLLRGAADTYFSGKILARYARVIVIADELRQLKTGDGSLQSMYDDADEEWLQSSIKAAASVNLPTDKQIDTAIGFLKKGVEAWLDSDAEAPFVFDETWGGLVNCGCRYVGKGEHGYCNNTFPDCPALVDVNEDFGNGYYNDHHYHYGYHLYSAAVAAKFDPEWAAAHFEDILLYIRDFANPTSDDEYFPQYRQKDWFLGSSWASGIVSAENSPHGRNEESSSEAISAYEAIALFGSAMIDAYHDAPKKKQDVARLIQQSGQLLTATELQATNRYWHVWSSTTHNSTYPSTYQQPVVGMLYDTMASFQTWFAPWAVVSYGIQLLPLTPVAERRDDPEWAAVLYPKYEEACKEAGDFCVENGWSILQAGLLATTGDKKSALKQALAVPAFVFETEGGMGNSLTNTIWFVATRKDVSAS
jgi:endo-1,3(4)-beta-glucanase